MFLMTLSLYIIFINFFFFFFNDTATTEIYTLSLHDALPICPGSTCPWSRTCPAWRPASPCRGTPCTACRGRTPSRPRSEEHTSELQSRLHLVCRLLLEKKKNNKNRTELYTLDVCAI